MKRVREHINYVMGKMVEDERGDLYFHSLSEEDFLDCLGMKFDEGFWKGVLATLMFIGMVVILT